MKKQEKMIVLAIIIVFILFGFGGGIYFWFSSNQKNNIVSTEFDIYGKIDYEKYEKFNMKKEDIDVLFKRMKETEEALKTDPNDYEYLIELGGFQKMLREYDASLATYDKAVKAYPDYGAAYAESADILIYPLGRFAEAEDYLKKAIEKSPYRSDYYRWLADLYIAKFPEKKGEIESLMIKGVEKTPDNASAFYSYLVSYFQHEGDLNKAIEYAKKYIQSAPAEEKENFQNTLKELQAELNKGL